MPPGSCNSARASAALAAPNALRLSATRVERIAVLCERDEYGALVLTRTNIEVALARCSSCGSRTRVLPSDILPQKTYGLAAIEFASAEYAKGDRGLRGVVWSISGDSPRHATLHAWTEGQGAYVLGRDVSEPALGEPFAAVLAETLKRQPSIAPALETAPAAVNPRRYRSEERRERLAGLAKLLALARLAAADEVFPLCAWRQCCLAFSLRAPLVFRTGYFDTRFERAAPGRSHPEPHHRTLGGSACPPRSRSPPSASSRSHRSSTTRSRPPRSGA